MKRTKIALALSMCVLCLGMLAFAVYSAVTSATFNLNGTINFNPEGVYVDIEGKVLRGSSRTDLVELTGDNFTYKDRNYDDSTGETSGNFTMTSWSPEVAFLPSERFIQYQVTITNKSGEPITAIPSDVTAITDVTATEEVSAVLRIEPGEMKTYKLTLESTGDSAITDAQVSLDFDIRTTSAYVEEQNNLGAISFTQSNGTITAVSGDNSTSSSPSLQKVLFIPETVDSTTITEYGSGSSISLSSNINFVIFEANLESIGKSAFQNLRSLEGIGLPISLTSIGSYAFCACSNLRYIQIPSGITSILGNTFEACSSLQSIQILAEVSSIEYAAFRRCTSLESVSFAENSKLNNIGVDAFSYCISLKCIEIPSNLTSIGSNAFNNCGSLQIEVANDNANYSSDNGSLYNKAKTELIRGAGGVSTINILGTVTNIGANAFGYCSALTEIVIPEGVISIGNSAFRGCSGLTRVSLPSSVTSIGSYVFDGCSNLNSINYLGTIEQWCAIEFSDSSSNPTYYTHTLNIQGEEITNLVIPESVTSIGNYSFYGCSGLTEIVIPEGVKSIGNSAFSGCSGLTSASLPSTLTSIGNNVFYSCSNLNSINYLGTIEQWCAIEFSDSSSNPTYYTHTLNIQGEEITNLVIPESVTSIGKYAFYGCSGLTEIVIPEGVTSIGNYAFYGCSGLTSVSLPSSVTSIGSYAFRDCTSLASLTINTQAGYVWQKASSSSSDSWTTVDVSKPEQNATWFKGFYGYYNYYWRQIAA